MPDATADTHGAAAGGMPEATTPATATPAISTPAIITLRRRADFLAASRGRRVATPGFVVQARQRRTHEDRPEDRGDERDSGAAAHIRVGYTCSKKVGSAVRRNRAKRRLRALAARVVSRAGRPGWDYVLIGRRDETARRDFALMAGELDAALHQLHGPTRPTPP